MNKLIIIQQMSFPAQKIRSYMTCSSLDIMIWNHNYLQGISIKEWFKQSKQIDASTKIPSFVSLGQCEKKKKKEIFPQPYLH